jgi:hypothetical protein
VEKSAGESQALTHAARELPNRHSRGARQSNTLQPEIDSAGYGGDPGNPGEEVQVFSRREVFVDSDTVAEEADLQPSLVASWHFTKQVDCAALKRRQAGENAEERRLPCSISSEECAARPFRYRQSEFANGGVITIEFPDVI